jgi:AcrR family transcriptional regulator
MGRRSNHTPDELRELILSAATSLVVTRGLAGLSARLIARDIGYSPGTLYNIFDDLDDIILTMEARLLDRLAVALAAVPPSPDPVQHICDLATAYLAFSQDKPRLWNLLLEHHMPNDWKVPSAFQARLDALLLVVERALTPLIPSSTPEQRTNITRGLWAMVHGVSSLATADKLTHVSAANAPELLDELVRTDLAGLSARATERPHGSATRRSKAFKPV